MWVVALVPCTRLLYLVTQDVGVLRGWLERSVTSQGSELGVQPHGLPAVMPRRGNLRGPRKHHRRVLKRRRLLDPASDGPQSPGREQYRRRVRSRQTSAPPQSRPRPCGIPFPGRLLTADRDDPPRKHGSKVSARPASRPQPCSPPRRNLHCPNPRRNRLARTGCRLHHRRGKHAPHRQITPDRVLRSEASISVSCPGEDSLAGQHSLRGSKAGMRRSLVLRALHGIHTCAGALRSNPPVVPVCLTRRPQRSGVRSDRRQEDHRDRRRSPDPYVCRAGQCGHLTAPAPSARARSLAARP
jgi:hypothetical protein